MTNKLNPLYSYSAMVINVVSPLYSSVDMNIIKHRYSTVNTYRCIPRKDMIVMKDGTIKPIEDLKVGMRVHALQKHNEFQTNNIGVIRSIKKRGE